MKMAIKISYGRAQSVEFSMIQMKYVKGKGVLAVVGVIGKDVGKQS